MLCYYCHMEASIRNVFPVVHTDLDSFMNQLLMNNLYWNYSRPRCSLRLYSFLSQQRLLSLHHNTFRKIAGCPCGSLHVGSISFRNKWFYLADTFIIGVVCCFDLSIWSLWLYRWECLRQGCLRLKELWVVMLITWYLSQPTKASSCNRASFL